VQLDNYHYVTDRLSTSDTILFVMQYKVAHQRQGPVVIFPAVIDLSAVFGVLSREHGRMSGLPGSLHNLALDRRMTCARHSQARPNTEQTASARERRPNIATGLRSSASVAESKGGLPIVEFADQTAWESWLQRNHHCQDGVWMKLAKKTAPVKTQTHAEALQAALCYGWIDGQAARYDDHYMLMRYMLMRFTPRRRRSKWSQINRERAQQLIALVSGFSAGRARQGPGRRLVPLACRRKNYSQGGNQVVLFVVWELTRRKPVMDLRMFKNPNFAAAAAMIFVFGVELYGIIVFTPQFVQAFMGYNAELAGLTQLPGAALMILLMPIAGKLVRKIATRWLIGIGFLLSAFALFHISTNIDLQIDFQTAANYRVLQSLGLALLFVPINTASYVGIPEEKGGEVSGTINLLRNVGGSVGISLVETMLARRAQFHEDELIAHVTRAQQSFRTLRGGLSAQLFHRGLSQPQAMRQTYLRVYDAVIAQATVQSYMDVAWVIAVVCLVMVPVIFMLKKNDPKSAHVSAE
jgi:Major Facilitator Superfamily